MKAVQRNNRLITFLAFGLYFMLGASALVVGSSLNHLMEVYGKGMDIVVLLGSSYALGRVSTVGLTGKLVEKVGPKAVYVIAILMTCAYFLGLALTANYYAGMVFAFLGGIGMGAEDAVCPLMLSVSCKKNYAGALSAGQAFFCIGGFVTPFLIGIMLTNALPFYYSYFLLTFVAIVLLACVPFVKLKLPSGSEQEEEYVKPLYAKRTWLAYAGVLLGCVCYCGATNVLTLYTSSFAENMGMSSANAAFMLTAYNVGGVVGSFAFIWVLKKIKEQVVLILNCVIGLAAIVLAILFNHATVYFICLFVAGIFLGVMFSLFIAIATRIGYKHISVSSSYVAIAGGVSDIMTPIISGSLVGILGVGCSFYYALVMVALMLGTSVLVSVVTSEKEGPDNGNPK